MTVELDQIRDLLMPGLIHITERYAFHPADWRGVFGTYETTMAAPHIWVPKLTLPQAAAAGVAAAIITNPVITRRFWAGWMDGTNQRRSKNKAAPKGGWLAFT